MVGLLARPGFAWIAWLDRLVYLHEGIHGVLEVKQVPDALVEGLDAVLVVGNESSNGEAEHHQQRRVPSDHDSSVEGPRCFIYEVYVIVLHVYLFL